MKVTVKLRRDDFSLPKEIFIRLYLHHFHIGIEDLSITMILISNLKNEILGESSFLPISIMARTS